MIHTRNMTAMVIAKHDGNDNKPKRHRVQQKHKLDSILLLYRSYHEIMRSDHVIHKKRRTPKFFKKSSSGMVLSFRYFPSQKL